MVAERPLVAVVLSGIFVVGAGTREDIVEVFDALDGEFDRLCELSFEVLTTPERLRALKRLDRVVRRLRTPRHALINALAAQAGEEELGGSRSAHRRSR